MANLCARTRNRRELNCDPSPSLKRLTVNTRKIGAEKNFFRFTEACRGGREVMDESLEPLLELARDMAPEVPIEFVVQFMSLAYLLGRGDQSRDDLNMLGEMLHD